MRRSSSHTTDSIRGADGLKKIVDAIAKDLWVVLLDIVAVNASYYLALLIRFYVNFQLRPVAVDRYLPAWIGFTPWYTIISILVFIAFRLYGGIWRYAGIHDMNRIITANVVTTIIHILGTVLFFTRMPITYYVIGGLLQFFLTVIIRFSYRALLVEKKRLNRRGKTNVLVVGSGENGRRVLKNLEDTDSYKPIRVYGSGSGAIDGIPVSDTLDLTDIDAVFIADPLLSTAEREKIRQSCGDKIEFHDYTGYFSNLGGRLPLTELLSTIHGPLSIEVDGEKSEYGDGASALREIREHYDVKEIMGPQITIRLEKKEKSTQDALKAAYAAVLGDDLPGGGGQ